MRLPESLRVMKGGEVSVVGVNSKMVVMRVMVAALTIWLSISKRRRVGVRKMSEVQM